MELYFVISILDRKKRADQERIYRALDLPVTITLMGRGTAHPDHLKSIGLTSTDKVVLITLADREAAAALIRRSKEEMFIDIPGNGIMLAVPIKSVGGVSTLQSLTNRKPDGSGKPDMAFSHELIYVILNEGFSDEVMDAAREAGAGGGTVLAAKGTGMRQVSKFSGMTISDEKEMILIVAKAEDKTAIMQAILDKAGKGSAAGAICFSVPVSKVAGLRVLEDEKEE